ncbi:hypothetical protein ACFC09_22865 [Streptomyces sp. NPDC056161]|uniref:hypothetical protein n=1 Tax=Streptomyces sp. NPDC056161 TaxID=3345732 RepID=UPI0035D72B3D
MNLSDSRTDGPGPRRAGATEAAPGHLRGAVERCVIERAARATGDRLLSAAEPCRRLDASRPVLRTDPRAPRTTGLTVTRTAKGTFVVGA